MAPHPHLKPALEEHVFLNVLLLRTKQRGHKRKHGGGQRGDTNKTQRRDCKPANMRTVYSVRRIHKKSVKERSHSIQHVANFLHEVGVGVNKILYMHRNWCPGETIEGSQDRGSNTKPTQNHAANAVL